MAKRVHSRLLLATALCLFSVAAFAKDYTYERIINDKAASVYPEGINASGAVVGSYIDHAGAYHGFIYQNHIFKSFDDPNAPAGNGTYSAGINDSGAIVGWYYPSRSNNHKTGFLYQNGSFTEISAPSADYTQAIGINDSGIIVGASEGPGFEHVFTWQNGKFTTIAEPDAPYETLAINASGSVIYENDYPFIKSFLYADGKATALPIIDLSSDDVSSENANGLNNTNVIIGAITAKTGKNKSYIYQNGTVKTFDVPGWYNSTAKSINNNNVVVGTVSNLGNQSAIYVYDGTSFSFVSVPKATNQRAIQINDAGQVLAAYVSTDDDVPGAFIATPKPGVLFQRE